MASTFTTNLNLEKIATGEKDDSWGGVERANQDLIDGEFGKANAGNPNTDAIQGLYVGQTLYDSTNEIIWACKTAANPGTWRAMSLAKSVKTAFYMAAAPVGWTIDTTSALADAAMRIVTSAGGVAGGSDTFAASFNGTKSHAGGAKAEAGATTETDGPTATGSAGTGATGSTALTVAQLAPHDHSGYDETNDDRSIELGGSARSPGGGGVTGTTGSGQGHTHTGPAHTHTIAQHTHPIAVHAHDVDTVFDVKFADFMVCTRD